MDCSPPGSAVYGISPARILEWVAISFSRGSSQPRDQTHISCTDRWILYPWATREAHPSWDLESEPEFIRTGGRKDGPIRAKSGARKSMGYLKNVTGWVRLESARGQNWGMESCWRIQVTCQTDGRRVLCPFLILHSEVPISWEGYLPRHCRGPLSHFCSARKPKVHICLGAYAHVCTHVGVRRRDKGKEDEFSRFSQFWTKSYQSSKRGEGVASQGVTSPCWMKATTPGDLCSGITSSGRLNRNEEYQPNSSLNRQYWNPARKNLSNILQTLITAQRNRSEHLVWLCIIA